MKVNKISYKFYHLNFFHRQTVRAQALVENWRILTVSAKTHIIFHIIYEKYIIIELYTKKRQKIALHLQYTLQRF